MQAATLPRIEHATLPNQPGHTIAYTYAQLSSGVSEAQSILVVFVNGLGLPQTFWQPTIDILKENLKTQRGSNVFCMTYDRYGQGLSRPADGSMPKPHDILFSVQELEDMIDHVKTKHDLTRPNVKICLVAHSIGVPLARLYCHQHPNQITAFIALDSNMADSDFISLMPDPDAPDFTADKHLPADTTIEQLHWTRENYKKMFHPSMPNPEGLDRSTLPSLLPAADSPLLTGPDGSPLLLTVVGHDPEAFAVESLRISTRGLTEQYMQPAWERYNHDLLKIGRTHKSVVVAPGSGHFVQKDNPQFVAGEVLEMLEIVRSGT